MKTLKIDRFETYAVILMALLTMTFFVAKPVFANESCEHGHVDKDKRGEFFEKRSADLHDQLQLTETQEDSWKQFIAKVRPQENAAKTDWSEISKLPAPERMERMLAVRKERLERMETRVQAVKEFYTQLTTEQRQIFDASFQSHRSHRNG
jgi:Spy/CpxP family protein refolding chaperone